jgi:hypothetical protein
VSTDEVAAMAISVGFADVRVLPATETGFYQPIVRAIRL